MIDGELQSDRAASGSAQQVDWFGKVLGDDFGVAGGEIGHR
jgi:hypothetical protein